MKYIYTAKDIYLVIVTQYKQIFFTKAVDLVAGITANQDFKNIKAKG
jgi:hypothetical protein